MWCPFSTRIPATRLKGNANPNQAEHHTLGCPLITPELHKCGPLLLLPNKLARGSSYRGLSWCVRDNLALRRQPRSRPVPPTGGATAVSFSKPLTRSHSGCLHPQLPCADRQWLSRRPRGSPTAGVARAGKAVRAAPPSLSWGARHSPHPAEGNLFFRRLARD